MQGNNGGTVCSRVQVLGLYSHLASVSIVATPILLVAALGALATPSAAAAAHTAGTANTVSVT